MTKKDITTFIPLPPRDYLVLFALTEGDRHGYGLVKDVESLTNGLVSLDPSNLYRSIKRLAEDGLVTESGQKKTPRAGGERRRFYAITPFGQRVVSAEAQRLADLTEAARARRLIPS